MVGENSYLLLWILSPSPCSKIQATSSRKINSRKLNCWLRTRYTLLVPDGSVACGLRPDGAVGPTSESTYVQGAKQSLWVRTATAHTALVLTPPRPCVTTTKREGTDDEDYYRSWVETCREARFRGRTNKLYNIYDCEQVEKVNRGDEEMFFFFFVTLPQLVKWATHSWKYKFEYRHRLIL